jgi:hypothetical protein
MITDTEPQTSGPKAASTDMKSLHPTADALYDVMVAQTAEHFSHAETAMRKSCEHALLAGLRLVWLHYNSVEPKGGDRRSINVPCGTLIKGFESAIAKIGMAKTTAYRWMNATRAAALRSTLLFDDDDLAETLPAPGTPQWESWEKSLKTISQGMSLNRLMLGTSQASTEEHRYDELITADEEGRQRATDLLAGVSAGKYTLVAACKALGSQEAYDKLRSEGAEKVRRDPVYLKMDGETGQIGGLFVTSLTTLRNTFQHWDDTPAPARKKARELWLEVVTSLPSDLKNG